MELTRTEENRNKAISATITLLIFALFILFLILFKLITPNPPFPVSSGGTGQEFALGMMNLGNSDLDYSAMGKATTVVAEKQETSENLLTDDEGEAVNLNTKKPAVKENKMVITPVKPQPAVVKEPVKELTPAEKLALKFKSNSGKSGGGIGNNEEAGQNGSPDGDPFKHGNGGSGGGNDGGNGTGSGPGSGSSVGTTFGADLRGRTVVARPKFPSDTKEEGKVVVEITVNAQGEVIEAIPNGRGTTTSSSALKAKAKKAAMETKFNVDGKYEEQKGTITIIFSFH